MLLENTGSIVKEFYNATPFPDYNINKFDTPSDLKSAASYFAKALDRNIPEFASVIDVGCGTGQLAAFLSLRRQNVLGVDFSDSSLNKAMALKEKLKLSTLQFKKMDVMDLDQIENIGMKFDYVLCFGVLHHTEDARQGFGNITNLLRPNGRIAIGIYNKFGRMPLKVRIFLAKRIFKSNNRLRDKYIEYYIGKTEDAQKKRSWWNDQFEHPHETTHTVGDVLGWFKEKNIRFCHMLPDLGMDLRYEVCWTKRVYPYWPMRVYKQLTWLWETQREGGYWIMFGEQQNG